MDIITYNILATDKVRTRDSLENPLHVEVGINPFGNPGSLSRWAKKACRTTKTSVLHVTPLTDVTARVAYGRFRRLNPEGASDIRYREFLTLVRAVDAGAVPEQDFLTVSRNPTVPVEWSPLAYRGSTRSPGTRGSLARTGTPGSAPSRGISKGAVSVARDVLLGSVAQISDLGVLSSAEDVGDLIRAGQNASYLGKGDADFSGFLDREAGDGGTTELRLTFPFLGEDADETRITVPFGVKVR